MTKTPCQGALSPFRACQRNAARTAAGSSSATDCPSVAARTSSVCSGSSTVTVAPDGVYSGYVVADEAPSGLETIYSPPPKTEVSLNLLNVFYAVEWVIFAGFAVFLWYRLVKDAWEEENLVDADPDEGAD